MQGVKHGVSIRVLGHGGMEERGVKKGEGGRGVDISDSKLATWHPGDITSKDLCSSHMAQV